MKQREFTEEFKREAVRILTMSGRSISSVAEDLGIRKSTLDRWRRNFAENDLFSGPHEDMSQELARLRKESELLRQERDLLKNTHGLLARMCAVETLCAILLIRGELPMSYWRHSTPLKNVAHGLLRT